MSPLWNTQATCVFVGTRMGVCEDQGVWPVERREKSSFGYYLFGMSRVEYAFEKNMNELAGIRPNIEGGQEAAGIMRHIDLFPTILSALSVDIPSFADGVDITQEAPEYGYSLSTANVYAFGAPHQLFEAASVLDVDGRHVVNHTSLARQLLTAVGLLGGTDWKSKHLRRTPSHIPAALGHYVRENETFGEPGFMVKKHARSSLMLKLRNQSRQQKQVNWIKKPKTNYAN